MMATAKIARAIPLSSAFGFRLVEPPASSSCVLLRSSSPVNNPEPSPPPELPSVHQFAFTVPDELNLLQVTPPLSFLPTTTIEKSLGLVATA